MLKELLRIEEKLTAWVEWVDGIEFHLSYIGRPELEQLTSQATKTVFVKHQAVEKMDDQRFLTGLIKRTVLDWRGVTAGKLANILPLDITGVGADTDIPFSVDDMAVIADNAYGFGEWLRQQITDLTIFQAERLEDDIKN